MINAPRSPSAEALCIRHDPARVYAWLGGISLFILVFLVPPFQIPDEPQHFFRSYQLSRIEVWSRAKNGVAGSDLPASLPDLVQHFMGTNVLHTGRVLPAQRLMETFGEMKRHLEPERTIFVNFGTGAYAPVPYIPAAIAIAASRSLGIGPLGLFYAGRIANAVVAMLLTCVALRLFPVGRKFALVIALLPMTQFQTASLSPDAMTIACALLFAAILAQFLTDGGWSARRFLAAFASGAVMCSVKIVYVPLLFAGLGALLVRGRSIRPEVRIAIVQQLSAAGVTIVALALWLGTNLGGVTQIPEGVDIGGQLAFVFHHPEKFFVIVLRSFYGGAEFLSISTVGLLGWLNLRLPNWVYGAVGVALLLGAYTERREAPLPVTVVAWLLLLAATAVMLVELALYLTWTPVGFRVIEGVQGRYFIPVLPLFGFATTSLLARRRPACYPNEAYACMLLILGVTTVAMHVVIIKGYGLF